jgi:sulfur-oxidizing protein SoxY
MKEAYRHMASRRDVVLGSAGIAVAWTVPSLAVLAQGNPEDVRSLLRILVGDATPSEGKILLDLPEIAENGNTIPYMVRVESPMTEADFVKAVHILAPANPHPRVGSFFFTPQSGKAAVSSRMRLAQTQDVLAVAEMSDGTFNTGKRTVKVTVGGCGG